MTTQTITPQRSNTTLWILLASFLIPAIAAYGYFFLGDRPTPHSNGELILPVVDVENLQLKDVLGNSLDRDTLTPKWRMLYFTDGSCDTLCIESLYNMRQINIALGKNQDRVQHAIIHLETADQKFAHLLEAEHKEAFRLSTEKQSIPASLHKDIRAIYLMDPNGNIMMRFPESLDPKLILKDINKLLKISRIG